ncbi:ABC-F family ATP-binding cassette domain-containing protein [Rubellimicrobium sp. CFH 75288]|uniref:ABC-F family ATP-binding cassette domain-containing protein n=1 Tax=Rubellimicrobium sp. CFH 75288 TaxID=2697034 RepID=UPI001411DEB2|nr:ABC-F family ATP-binding cassette domain-containing protein [Rubellimicrobium sp. CFH 75288]NAZ36152.1 ATP-binding cassette domain-containing protein [Rubellimicrobium sp. CFH 75288]
MLRIESISASVAGRPLFENASATIPAGHKVGLVGRNGSGKTTLFRLIRGELPLEAGRIEVPRGARIGGVAQEVPGSETSLLDTVLAADTERAALLAERTDDPVRIAEIQARLQDIGAWSAEARAASILRGLGFSDEETRLPCSAFSGGWRMRVALAAVLFAQPDLLLLDEPTNYLDLEGALWLEGYIARYPHTVVIISHDRDLLNRSVTGILHLSERRLEYWTGGYDAFARARAARRALLQAEKARQDAARAHLQSFVDRFRYKASKARQAQSRLKMIERMETIRLPEDAARTVFTFPEPEEMAPPLWVAEGAAVGYGGPPVLSRLDLRIDPDDRIALLGRNGEGKSTLAKLIAGRLSPQSGRLIHSPRLRTGYFAQHQVDELDLADTPLDHLRRRLPDEAPARLRARLAGFGLLAAQAETAVGRLSGGQKARLSLLLATLDAPHLLILDEPTNHLDIESREALIEALAAYRGAVVLVSHDMHLLSLVADRLWLVRGGRVRPFDDDLEAYRALLLAAEPAAPATSSRPAPPRPVRPSRDAILALRAEVRRCEERVAKIEAMRDTLAARLADPALYEDGRVADLEAMNRKYAEILEALARAETLWAEAQTRLDEAEAA